MQSSEPDNIMPQLEDTVTSSCPVRSSLTPKNRQKPFENNDTNHSLSLKRKYELIQAVQNAPASKRKKDIAAEFEIPANTLSTILKNQKQIIEKYQKQGVNPERKRLRSGIFTDVEDALLNWLNCISKNKIEISWSSLQEKANALAKNLGHPDFQCSAGWWHRFKQRNNVTCNFKKSSTLGETTKRRLKGLSLKKKYEIIQAAVQNAQVLKKKKDIAVEFDIPANTLSSILKNKDQIIERYQNQDANTDRKRIRSSSFTDIEKALLTWVKTANKNNIVMSWTSLIEKANDLGKELGHSDFQCTNGWLARFKGRYNICWPDQLRQKTNVMANFKRTCEADLGSPDTVTSNSTSNTCTSNTLASCNIPEEVDHTTTTSSNNQPSSNMPREVEKKVDHSGDITSLEACNTNPNLHILVPNLLPQTQVVPQTMLSEPEGLVLQREEGLKRQELEATKLEVGCRTQFLQLEKLQSQGPAVQNGPRAAPQSSDRQDAEIKSTAHSKRSGQTCASQEPTALKSKHARSQTASHRPLTPQGVCQQGTHTANTVKSTHSSPRRDQDRSVQAQDLAAFKTDIAVMMRDMIKSSLTELGVVSKTTPPQSQSNSRDPIKELSQDEEPSQDLEDSSEGEEENAFNHEDPKLEQGNFELDQGNPKLDHSILTAEDQPDLNSFALTSPSVSLPMDKTPLSKVSQENPEFYSQAQTQAHLHQTQPTINTQARSATSTQAQPLLNQAQLAQVPAQAQIQAQVQASLREKQARSELLDKVAKFCGLERSDAEDKKKVLGMMNPTFHEPTRASINLSLPWHSSAVEIADRNFDIVNGKLSKSMEPLNPAQPWGPKDFFSGIGYPPHNLAGYVPKPESLDIPSRPPPAEQSAEDQPFYQVPRHPGDPQVRVDITSGSISLTASQLQDQEDLSRKNAAAISNALSIAEYVYNLPGMPEGAKAALHQLKLDLVAGFNFSWRSVHNYMMMRRSIALDNLTGTLPPIDEDQKVALLHAPFKGTTLFGGELAKLHKANTERASAFTVFPTPAPPSDSYARRPYVGRGRSYNYHPSRRGGYSQKRGGRSRGQGRSATITKPAKDGQTTRTVPVPQDSNNRKVDSWESLVALNILIEERAEESRNSQNEGMIPP